MWSFPLAASCWKMLRTGPETAMGQSHFSQNGGSAEGTESSEENSDCSDTYHSFLEWRQYFITCFDVPLPLHELLLSLDGIYDLVKCFCHRDLGIRIKKQFFYLIHFPTAVMGLGSVASSIRAMVSMYRKGCDHNCIDHWSGALFLVIHFFRENIRYLAI